MNKEYGRLPNMSSVRAVAFVVGLLLATHMAWASEKGKNKVKKSSHPEVWGVELPTDGVGRAEDSIIVTDSQGRVLIGYRFTTGMGRVYRVYDFFGQSVTREWKLPLSTDQKQEKVRLEEEISAFEQTEGTTILATDRGKPPFLRALIQFKDGSELRFSPISTTYGRKTSFYPCNYHFRASSLGRYSILGPNRESLNPTYQKIGPSTSSTIIRFYHEPESFDQDTLCECTGEMVEAKLHGRREVADPSGLPGCSDEDATRWNLSYQTRAFNVIAADLKDGTYLLKDRGYPTVIRFHEQGHLQSPYLAKRDDLFVVKTREIGTLAKSAVQQWRQANNKKEVYWGVDRYTAEDLAGIFRILDPIVVEYLQGRESGQKNKSMSTGLKRRNSYE